MKTRKIDAFVDCMVIFIVNLCVIIFGIWISAIPLTKSKNFYMSHFEHNQAAINHLQSDHMFKDYDPYVILEDVAEITIDYYFGNSKEYQVMIDGTPLFNEDEVRHMKDVKDLYVGGQIIAVIAFVLMVGGLFYLAIHFRRIRKRLVVVTCVFYGVVILLVGAFFLWGYISYINAPELERNANGYFVYAFINFHYLLFPFNPDKVALATGQNGYDIYTLTRILDDKLFMDAGIIIGIVTFCVIILWFIVIIAFYKLHKKLAKKVDEIHEQARITRETIH